MDKAFLDQLIADNPCRQEETDGDVLYYTPPFRMGFGAFVDPKPPKGKPELKTVEQGARFGCMLGFPPQADVTPLRKAMTDAAKARWPSAKKGDVHLTLKEAATDEEKSGEPGLEAGGFVLNANSQYPIALVDGGGVPISPADESKVYDGGWWIACLSAPYTYDVAGKGVAMGLRALQFVAHDKKITGQGAKKALAGFKTQTGAKPANGTGQTAKAPATANELW